MPRVKRGPKRAAKRKKVLKLASGFWGTKHNAYRMAMQAVDRAGKLAFRDRRAKKRDFRSLWILRINAASHQNGLSYNRLIAGLDLCNRRAHPAHVGPALFMLDQHHADRTAVPRYAVLLQRRKQNLFFLIMVTLIGEVADKVERLLPVL